ncbi:uncharacterized protein LOC122064472 [Macadamia integrifolia]|uniref:uncharacterized protein LOC122064472 n=1 Tax=Macadamia integrifolia TaxID=60698 RepID=UPI001C4EF518|nr:uncharacterized protein LOC122064472 [Macadamia integrifolia]
MGPPPAVFIDCPRGDHMTNVVHLPPLLLVSHLTSIKALNGTNHKEWLESLTVTLAIMHLDTALLTNESPKPTVESNIEAKTLSKEWEESNRLCTLVIRHTIDKSIRESIIELKKAKDFLAAVAKKFQKSDKAKRGTYLKMFSNTKYDGVGGVCNHILKMTKYANKLPIMEVKISDAFLVWQIIESLPAQFDSLKKSYNANNLEWNIE